ncbi:MAG: DegV family protein [Lachnospiraceae bacterium]|nr:DegV family protein [Lachnospiraceae bacterium]
MSDYKLTCCSTADLSAGEYKSRGIEWVPFHVEINGKEYLDDRKDISIEDFYGLEREGAFARTSQVNEEQYKEMWEPFLKDGLDILHLTLSSGISGTINSANLAADELRDKYPDRKLYVVDSLCASSGYGLFMLYLADLRDRGKSLDELRDWAIANRLKMNHWFFASDLKSFVRGGRISAASGAIGTLLGICPLLNVNNEGKLIPRAKIRTKKKVIEEIVKRMAELADDGLNYSGMCTICHSDCASDAEQVRLLVEKRFPQLQGKVKMCRIGTVIGAHTGTGTVALFFMGKERGE